MLDRSRLGRSLETVAYLSRNWKFESISLRQRVSLTGAFHGHGRERPGFAGGVEPNGEYARKWQAKKPSCTELHRNRGTEGSNPLWTSSEPAGSGFLKRPAAGLIVRGALRRMPPSRGWSRQLTAPALQWK